MQPGLSLRVYPGGHMTYLDDGSRPRIKADVAAWMAAPAPMSVAAASASARTTGTIASSSLPPRLTATPLPRSLATSPDIDRSALAQGGDPYLPPALRIAPTAPSPSGMELKALVERKIAERRADVYR